MGLWEDLTGQDKADLQKKIQAKQSQLESATGAMRDKYMAELEQLKGEYQRLMQEQGVVDSSGRLVEAKDIQGNYIDKDYLNMRRNQGQENESLALAQILKSQKQNILRNQGTINPAQVASALENAQRSNQQSLADDIRGETLRAKGETLTELGRKENYVTNLTNQDRQNIMDRLSLELQSLGLQGQQLTNMVAQFDAMPDSLLSQIATYGAKYGMQLLLNQNPIPPVPGKK